MTKEQKLKWLQRGPTRYELIGTNGQQTLLICYAMRPSRRTVLEALRKYGKTVLRIVNAGPEALLTFGKPAKLGASIGTWKFYFSGRTQRDAVVEGEHPFVGDLMIEEDRAA